MRIKKSPYSSVFPLKQPCHLLPLPPHKIIEPMLKSSFQKLFIAFAFSLCFLNAFSQNKKINVILIGTYHFNNPGNDAVKAKERNILSEESQKDLEQITNQLQKKYQPDQIFVESNFNQKAKLDQQYQLYFNNEFAKFTDTVTKPRMKRFYIEGETYQLAFRLAKKSGNKEVYPIDTLIEMRFDLLQKMVKADPVANKIFEETLASLTARSNDCLSKKNLKEVLLCMNEEADFNRNKGFYISFANALGKDGKYFGAHLVADWYKRNLIMYANIQHQLKPSAKNVVVLVGGGHAAMFREFFKNDENFNLIELKEAFK
ncbi:DUF5694 domain-containing protein [Pedobacter montanisoli]|uniref:DUF5694 domain-containing protein n=1 Tax=Pedobacter montanisoli TaxID=2923277 RepID=A0ABS9ZU65_9SPHI|nr:DUF5694 domain-containing protein [Pedobacter montanisoli]MCJ0742126.1 DUF5694 domain-containing protein [Pedobacter montanisoli]